LFSDELLSAAQYCLSKGVPAIPIGKDKMPIRGCNWKKYQSRLPTEYELIRMFSNPGITGTAIICGDVSNGLCVRDFDDNRSFDKWADQYPYLAKACPQAKTKRGKHVYFRSPISVPTQSMGRGKGEIRGNGGYVIIPESMHPDGGQYLWLAGEAPDFDDLPSIDPSYFCPPGRTIKQSVRQDNPLYTPLISLCNKGNIWESGLPVKYGQRRYCIFRLVQRFKFTKEAIGKSPNDFEKEFRGWWGHAFPFIRTKSWRISWCDFNEAWKCCRMPPGLGIAAMQAIQSPAIVPNEPHLDSALRLCQALSNNSQKDTKEFFLATRDATEFAGLEYAMQGSRLLKKAKELGYIECIKKGTQGVGGDASVWRWLRP